jgi:hypothetical protein
MGKGLLLVGLVACAHLSASASSLKKRVELPQFTTVSEQTSTTGSLPHRLHFSSSSIQVFSHLTDCCVFINSIDRQSIDAFFQCFKQIKKRPLFWNKQILCLSQTLDKVRLD